MGIDLNKKHAEAGAKWGECDQSLIEFPAKNP
jgi:hypothetical protein